jgi:hypothetical protein
LEQATDRSIEMAAGIPNQAEALDPILHRVSKLLGAQRGGALAGHIGSGALSSVDPLALFHCLCHISHRLNGSAITGIDAHCAAGRAIVELAFEDDVYLPVDESNVIESMALLLSQGVAFEPHPTDTSRIRITIPNSEASDA